MIKEKLNQMIETSLVKLLDDKTVKEKIVDIVLKSNDVSMTMNSVKRLVDNVTYLGSNLQEVSESIGQIIDTLKMHQDAIKNLVMIQDTLSKKAKNLQNDVALFTETSEKPTKPN